MRRQWRGGVSIGEKIYSDLKADPQKRLAAALRSSISIAITKGGGRKQSKTVKLIGCSVENFRRYIEGLWLPGMTWENYGVKRGCWHLDHRRPIKSFDLTNLDHQSACFHYSNYQPLWWIDNIRKGAKWDGIS